MCYSVQYFFSVLYLDKYVLVTLDSGKAVYSSELTCHYKENKVCIGISPLSFHHVFGYECLYVFPVSS